MIAHLRRHTFGEPHQPNKKPREYPETKAQIELVKWCRERPDVLVMRMENALKRRGGQATRDIAMGLCTGAPDLVLATPAGVVFAEMKAPKGSVSSEQEQIHNVLRNMGHTVLVCYGAEDGIRQLREFLER